MCEHLPGTLAGQRRQLLGNPAPPPQEVTAVPERQPQLGLSSLLRKARAPASPPHAISYWLVNAWGSGGVGGGESSQGPLIVKGN